MSRYLLQLARETRSRLRPPTNLKLAPPAEAFEAIDEERPATPAPAVPAPVRPPFSEARPATPERSSVEAVRPPAAAAVERPPERWPGVATPAAQSHPAVRERPESPASTPAARSAPLPSPELPPTSPKAVPQPAAMTPRPRSRAPQEEVIETTLLSRAFAVDDDRTDSKLPEPPDIPIPETVRNWLLREPAAMAARKSKRAPAPALQQEDADSSQPAIDVTIGSVEVTIESEPAPTLRAVRRPEPRVSPRRPAPNAASRLARQYLDR